MYYLMITIAALLFSLQFMFNNGYSKECDRGWDSSLKFSFYSSVTGLLALLFINKFKMDISMFSVIMAFVYGAVCVTSSYSSIKAFKYANLSVYSVFSMIGGMLLPFVYGIMCGEEFKAVRLICCVLIVISVLMSVKKGEQAKRAIKYYIAVFVLNGMVGVISKFHQMNTGLCVDSASFMILTKIATIFISVLLLFKGRKTTFLISKKAFAYSAMYSVVNSIGNLMLLIALIHLPASVQYPIVTGGVIIFATIIDIIRKEKLTKKEIAAACVAFLSAALMAL
ncbi:MAG: hypothetical protein IKW59_02490 [Clostridia bacterium]|nr:hypothetical protein [Clostridia bacterium]